MVATLYTLAYPVLSKRDEEAIEIFRAAHDPQFDLIRPHFTLAFGSRDVSPSAYISHVRSVALAFQPMRFHCRYAMLGSDYETERGFVYLVPDEGNSALSLMHDALYSGVLGTSLRLDREFVPHLTIGTFADRIEAKELCDQLNSRGVSVLGSIEALTVVAIQNGEATALEVFPLSASSSHDNGGLCRNS